MFDIKEFMVSIEDMHKDYEERMDEKDRNIVREFENFIDKQLVKTDGKARVTEWDLLIMVDKVIGGLTDEDYLIYKKAFRYVESRFKSAGWFISKRYAYTKEAMPLKYILERYRFNGYFIRFPKNGIIIIEKY